MTGSQIWRHQEERKNYDLMRVIVMRLGSQGENSSDDAIRLLSTIFSTDRTPEEKKNVLSDEFHIAITTVIDQEVKRMCNLSTGILERGLERGLKRGLEQGREQGMMETLFGLVKDGILSLADAAKRAGMDLSTFEKEYKSYCSK